MSALAEGRIVGLGIGMLFFSMINFTIGINMYGERGKRNRAYVREHYGDMMGIAKKEAPPPPQKAE